MTFDALGKAGGGRSQTAKGETMRDRLIKDIDAMEQVMTKTADRCDIWQDRAVYAIAKAVWDILQFIIKREDMRAL